MSGAMMRKLRANMVESILQRNDEGSKRDVIHAAIAIDDVELNDIRIMNVYC